MVGFDGIVKCPQCGKQGKCPVKHVSEEFCYECRRKKPPLGLKPRYIAEEERLKEIREAISQYINSIKPLQPEWIEEYNELVNKQIKIGLNFDPR